MCCWPWRFPPRTFEFKCVGEKAQQVDDVLRVAAVEQPFEQPGPQVFQDVGEVWLVSFGLGLRQRPVGGSRHGGGEVGGEDFGVEVLADGFGEFAGELFHAGCFYPTPRKGKISVSITSKHCFVYKKYIVGQNHKNHLVALSESGVRMITGYPK